MRRLPHSADAQGALVGLLVGVLVLVPGGVVLLSRPSSYTAAASIVVLPDPSLPRDQAASYYDTLSQGQIVGTFAEVLRASVGSSGPSDAPPITVLVVPDTSVVRLVATGASASGAEAAADQALTASAAPLAQLSAPYRASVVSAAAGHAQREGRPLILLVGVLLIVALGAGLLARRAARELDRLRGRPAPRPKEPAGAPHATGAMQDIGR